MVPEEKRLENPRDYRVFFTPKERIQKSKGGLNVLHVIWLLATKGKNGRSLSVQSAQTFFILHAQEYKTDGLDIKVSMLNTGDRVS